MDCNKFVSETKVYESAWAQLDNESKRSTTCYASPSIMNFIGKEFGGAKPLGVILPEAIMLASHPG